MYDWSWPCQARAACLRCGGCWRWCCHTSRRGRRGGCGRPGSWSTMTWSCPLDSAAARSLQSGINNVIKLVSYSHCHVKALFDNIVQYLEVAKCQATDRYSCLNKLLQCESAIEGGLTKERALSIIVQHCQTSLACLRVTRVDTFRMILVL